MTTRWWRARKARHGGASSDRDNFIEAADRETLAKVSLISAEVDRQLADVATRQSNAITRASIVLAAAGVSVFAAVETGDNVWLSTIPSILSFAAALVSLAGLRYWKSNATTSSAKRVTDLMNATTMDAQWSILNDKHKELAAARNDLKRKSTYVRWSTAILISAWTSVVAIRFVVDPLIAACT